MSERIGTDACRLSNQWVLAPDLARMLIALEARATQIFSAEGLRWPGIWIISGFRSQGLQAVVNPSAPRSLHTRCPSLAADLRVGDMPASTTPDFWRFLGTLWKALGGKWGGDFGDDNHFSILTVGDAPIEIGEVPVTRRLVPVPPTPV